METLSQAVIAAVQLIVGHDREVVSIIVLSLRVSMTAVAFAAVIGFALGAVAAMGRFRGRHVVVTVLNTFLGLPPVVVGLAVYLLLSRAGPLGRAGVLFTPLAMIIAQAILVTPIIAALSRQVIQDAWEEYREQLQSLGQSTLNAAMTLLWELRFSLVTIVLAGFGRAVAEVGAVMIVGGNINGLTRVMTTTIALETTKGDLPLALGLGMVLFAIVLSLNLTAYTVLEARRQRHD